MNLFKIEKPKAFNRKIIINLDKKPSKGIDDVSFCLFYSLKQIPEQALDEEEDSTQITPSFFSDIHSSEFVSVPININNKDDVDQCSSFIDYNENVFKSAQDRQREIMFKYENIVPKELDEDAKNNIKFHQKRRNTLSRDRVPTRKG